MTASAEHLDMGPLGHYLLRRAGAWNVVARSAVLRDVLAGCRSRQVREWAWVIDSGGAELVWSLVGRQVRAVGVPGAHADVCDLAWGGSSGFVRAAAMAKDPGAKLEAA